MALTSSKKLILVIGGTGAQGLAVIDSLLAPADDGSPSPYAVRVLTRDPDNYRAKKLAERPDVELFKGTVTNLEEVEKALHGVYGAFVNTDGFTIGEQAEVFTGIRIFELAKQTKTVKHFVWSSLPYGLKAGGYDPQYKCDHFDGKGRVAEFLKTSPSDDSMTWSVLTSAPYMDMLHHFFAPIGQRKDGAFVFAAPLGNGHVPLVALSDIGFFARHIFDNPTTSANKDFEVASDVIAWPTLVETFTRVTGQKAVYLPQTLDEYFDMFADADRSVAVDIPRGEGTTVRKNFGGWWRMWRDDIIKRDMDWIRSVNPKTMGVEEWMRQVGYSGDVKYLLKGVEARGGTLYNEEKLARLLNA